MRERPLRTQLRGLYTSAMKYTTSRLDDDDFGRSAVIFSPHPDDETLGCGGTIIKKKLANANVRIVFMTDGSNSPGQTVSKDELKAMRAEEAIAAGRILGVEEDNIVFLGFEDGRLAESRIPAVSATTAILQREQPEEVFIPYHKEWHMDHFVTTLIVLHSLQAYGRPATVCEYPIWFWRHWPWAGMQTNGGRDTLKAVGASAISGIRLLRDLRCSVYVGDVLDLKRAAFQQHRSQWNSLRKVANGDFLECFFQENEVFLRYSVPGKLNVC